MHKIYNFVVNHRKPIIVTFSILAVVGLFLQQFVGVDYDINDYLPDDSPSTQAINKMDEEFHSGIPNARAMVKNVTIPEAIAYKKKLAAIDGVTEVTWLDDAVDITTPLESLDQNTVGTYYKDDAALFSITIKDGYYVSAVADIRAIIGDSNALSGSAVNTADGTTNTVAEIRVPNF